MPRPLVLTLAILAGLGLAWRGCAPAANLHPHGDVHLDAITVHSMLHGDGMQTPLERSLEYYPRETGSGYPLDQHPPLALLAATALSPLASDGYAALQRASLAASFLLVAAVFLAGRALRGTRAGAIAAVGCACSFALADFAGNGAVYTQHALFAVLAVAALSRPTIDGAALGGAVLGLAWLTNYQALVLLPAAGAAVLAAGGADRRAWGRLAALGAGFALAVLPWAIRNALVFGDAGFTVNPFYLKWKLGGELAIAEEAGIPILTVGWPGPAALLGPLADHLRVNLRFVASQAPLWLGPLLPLAAAGVVTTWREGRARRSAALAALPLLFLAHLGVMLLWPACKFRYFVPLLPLAALLAAHAATAPASRAAAVARWLALGVAGAIGLEMLLRGRAPEGAVVLAAVAVAAVSSRPAAENRLPLAVAAFGLVQLVLFAASPTRTSYYDSVLVGDAFKRLGAEEEDRDRQDALAALVPRLAAEGVRSIVADVELKHHAQRAGVPLEVIQPPATGDATRDLDLLRAALARYGARHVLAESEAARAALARLEGYQGSTPCPWGLEEESFHLVEVDP